MHTMATRTKTTGRSVALFLVALLALASLASAAQANVKTALQSQAQLNALEASKTNAVPDCQCYCCAGNGCEAEYVGNAEVTTCNDCTQGCQNTYPDQCDAPTGSSGSVCFSDASRLRSGALLAAAMTVLALAIMWAL